jgi:hypothetical protein
VKRFSWFVGDRALGRRLRQERPQPAADLVDRIVAEVGPQRRHSSAPRLAFAGALTLVLAIGVAAFGGIGYAASSAEQAVRVVKRVFVASSPRATLVVAGRSSGGDQYEQGHQWGDSGDNHPGPPDVKVKEKPKVKKTADKVKVSTKVNIDEQAHLFVSIIGPDGKKLVINQKASKIGNGLSGADTKTLSYLMLLPRTISLDLALPKKEVKPGATYKIMLIARDPSGNKKTTLIPFSS